MDSKRGSPPAEDTIPIKAAHSDNDDDDDDEDIDSRGLVLASSSSSISHGSDPTTTPLIYPTLQRAPSLSRSILIPPHDSDSALVHLQYHFARSWHRIPASWSVERDSVIAFRHVLTLLGFLSLCVFVFSIPSLLYVVSPLAPTPPGTSPPLDEAASTVSGKQGAVAADVPRCSELGVHVLRELGGNAIDAAVSTMLCQGVLAPFASGIGGGALILIHSKRDREDLGMTRFYDARETAPVETSMESFQRNSSLARKGGLSIAVPGELKGLYRVHTDFGRLNWKDIVMPVVEIAQTAKVGKYLANKLKEMNDTIIESPSLVKIFAKKVLTKKGQTQQDAAAAAEIPGARRDINTNDKNYYVSTSSRAEGTNVLRRLFLYPPSLKAEGSMSKLTPTPSPTVGHGGNSKGGRKKIHGHHSPKLGDGNSDGYDNETHVIEVLKEGDILKNEALVGTLRAIAEHGPDAFYHNMSERITSEIRLAGGVMTSRDLRGYAVKVREVVQSAYQGFTILGASPPSTGGLSIAMALNMITELEFRKKGRNILSFRLLTECLKWVFGASMGLADPSYVTKSISQMKRMLSRREAMQHAYRIDPDRTFEPSRYTPGISISELEGGTSHVSVVDINGSAVSITSSINMDFGSRLLSSSSGVIFNDGMDAFTTDITRVNAYGMYPTRENAVQPGKRAATSMCPTIVMRGRRVYLVVGGSGGPKAISGVLQTLLNVLDFGDPLADAISAPRIHHQLIPNVVSFEAANVTTCEITDELKKPSESTGGSTSSGGGWPYWGSVCEGLKEIGHHLHGPDIQGTVQAVLVPGALSDDDGDDRTLYAASDHRRIGKAAAY